MWTLAEYERYKIHKIYGFRSADVVVECCFVLAAPSCVPLSGGNSSEGAKNSPAFIERRDTISFRRGGWANGHIWQIKSGCKSYLNCMLFFIHNISECVL